MRILVVEDDKLLNSTLCYNLSMSGYDVDSALSKGAAMRFFAEQTYGLAVLDVNLPDGNGFDICKLIKEKQDIPVIFLTAQDEETSVVIGLDLGADDYITKPFRTRELISRINSVLRRYELNRAYYDD